MTNFTLTDRSVEFPNRYQLNPVEGENNTYDFVPVPGVVAAPGTPVNKALFDNYPYNFLDGVGMSARPLSAGMGELIAPKVGDVKLTTRTLGGKWLPCDGSAIDPAQYPELYKVLQVDMEKTEYGSADLGSDWTMVSGDPATDGTLWAVCVRSGYSCSILYTDNPAGEWKRIDVETGTSTLYARSFVYGNGYWVILVGEGNSSTVPYLLVTDDLAGNSWTKVECSFRYGGTEKMRLLRFTGGKFVIVSHNLYFHYAENPLGEWTVGTNRIAAASSPEWVAHGGTYWVVGYSSTDADSGHVSYTAYYCNNMPGGAWVRCTWGFASAKMNYVNGMWIAAYTTKVLYGATPAATPTTATVLSSDSLYSNVFYIKGKYWFVSATKLYYTETLGATLTEAEMITYRAASGPFFGASYGGGTIVINGAENVDSTSYTMFYYPSKLLPAISVTNCNAYILAERLDS